MLLIRTSLIRARLEAQIAKNGLEYRLRKTAAVSAATYWTEQQQSIPGSTQRLSIYKGITVSGD